jgi:diaminohydroxyphosphoribosylaminopyrimidine deaminase/5-amino-6-(5-phosphoribosylamino)uracil reductase
MPVKEGTDRLFMTRCIELASLGKGNTYPNPLVGSVVTYKDSIIGEGYHQEYGKAHAEANAISAVAKRDLLENSTLYVSLEPCCHIGKTPPCTNLIIDTGIPRVVIGSVDPNPVVTGNGIEVLRNAGCDVLTGIMDIEGRYLNRRYFSYYERNRPYVILKWAESKDGFLDNIRSPHSPVGPNWITQNVGQTLVHKWRAEEQAIMVGSGTAMIDNPSLTVRHWTGRQPLRITISRKAKLAKNLQLLDQKNKTLIYTEQDLEPEGNNVFVKLNYEKEIPEQIVRDLYERKIQSLMVEGGAQLLTAFICSGLWDEAIVFTGNKNFFNGLRAPVIKSPVDLETHFDQCGLKFFRNQGV